MIIFNKIILKLKCSNKMKGVVFALVTDIASRF